VNRTKIEWVKNPDGSQGSTWNPITGCLNHVNGICKGGGFPCYAYRLAHTRLKQRYLANPNTAASQIISDTPINMMQKQVKAELDPFYPRFWEERLNALVVHPKRRKGIFVCDMGELFGDWVPREWQEKVFSVIRAHPQHRFYLLTKQPQNLIKWSPFPDNCWVGTTATNNAELRVGLQFLNAVDAKVRFVSLEPLLSWNDRAVWDTENRSLTRCLSDLDWIIIGQQTPVSKATTPKLEWIHEIVEAADKAGVKVFLKNNLEESPEIAGHYPFYCDATGFPLHHLRQQLPEVSPERV